MEIYLLLFGAQCVLLLCDTSTILGPIQYSRKTVDNYGLQIVNILDIPCRQSPKPNKLTESKTEQCRREVEAHKAKRSLLARIFSPDSIDWLDEQMNRYVYLP